MAKKISELPSVTKLTNDSTLIANQGGSTYRVTNILQEGRGDEIINKAKLASIAGQASVHDCHIIAKQPADDLLLVIVYRISDNYYVVTRNADTNAIIYNQNILAGTNTGWSPRMIEIDTDTVRVIYTKSNTSVYYKDMTVSTGVLGAETNFQVQIKDAGGTYTAAQQLTLDCFLEHVANVTGIDYRDAAYDTFASRHMLVTDTQQMQLVEGVYYLTAEVLADTMPNGDTGGIACLIKSTDLVTWQIMNPVSITTTIDDQRDHETSVTYLDGKWHAMSRLNRGTFTDTSGYKYYTSTDGETWTHQGMAGFPNAMKGIRHSVFKYTLEYAAPSGASLNLSEKNVAIITYQRTPTIHSNNNITDATHALRTELGICWTEDFVTFNMIAVISDRNMVHYPSTYVYQDRLFLAWSSGFLGTGLLSSIMYSDYNLSKI